MAFIFTPNDVCSVNVKVTGIPTTQPPDFTEIDYRHLRPYIFYDPPWYISSHAARQNFFMRGFLEVCAPLTTFAMNDMYKLSLRFAHSPGVRLVVYGISPVIDNGVVKCYYVISELERI